MTFQALNLKSIYTILKANNTKMQLNKIENDNNMYFINIKSYSPSSL